MLTGTAWAARFDNIIIIEYREAHSLSTRTNNKLLDVRSGQIASSVPSSSSLRPVTHVFSTSFSRVFISPLPSSLSLSLTHTRTHALSHCVFIFRRRIKQIRRAADHSHFPSRWTAATWKKSTPRPRVINAFRVICTALRVFRTYRGIGVRPI